MRSNADKRLLPSLCKDLVQCLAQTDISYIIGLPIDRVPEFIGLGESVLKHELGIFGVKIALCVTAVTGVDSKCFTAFLYSHQLSREFMSKNKVENLFEDGSGSAIFVECYVSPGDIEGTSRTTTMPCSSAIFTRQSIVHIYLMGEE
jgi:hypothetical protein